MEVFGKCIGHVGLVNAALVFLSSLSGTEPRLSMIGGRDVVVSTGQTLAHVDHSSSGVAAASCSGLAVESQWRWYRAACQVRPDQQVPQTHSSCLYDLCCQSQSLCLLCNDFLDRFCQFSARSTREKPNGVLGPIPGGLGLLSSML